MDVFTLNPTTYLPDKLVEGYDSMIWTERFVETGEFQLKTPLVAETRALIPEGTLITLLDTNEVMMVETHSIENNADSGAPELTATGRSIDMIVEDRLMTGIYQTPWKSLRTYTEAELAALLLWNFTINTTDWDVTRVFYGGNSLNAIPNLVITDSTTKAGTKQTWWFQDGQISDMFTSVLTAGHLGVRSIRPPSDTANVVTFDITNAAATHGVYHKTATSNLSKLRMDIYQGTDRTGGNNPIVFHYQSGHIDNPKYLFSRADYKNVGTFNSNVGGGDVYEDVNQALNYKGFGRKALYIDAGTKADDANFAEFINAAFQQADFELRKHNRAVLFDGAISPLSPYRYNQEYFLGDKVTLSAEYGFNATMLVAEHVRTNDQDGDRGYPTLILAT